MRNSAGEMRSVSACSLHSLRCQLELVAQFVLAEKLPLMMHAAETLMEVSLLHEGRGAFADGLRNRGIEWQPPEFPQFNT